jgi:putative ABC transport system permease protein
VLATRLFGLPYHANPWLWLYGPLAGALLVGLSGVLAARSVMNTPPSLTLRAGG